MDNEMPWYFWLYTAGALLVMYLVMHLSITFSFRGKDKGDKDD